MVSSCFYNDRDISTCQFPLLTWLNGPCWRDRRTSLALLATCSYDVAVISLDQLPTLPLRCYGDIDNRREGVWISFPHFDTLLPVLFGLRKSEPRWWLVFFSSVGGLCWNLTKTVWKVKYTVTGIQLYTVNKILRWTSILVQQMSMQLKSAIQIFGHVKLSFVAFFFLAM